MKIICTLIVSIATLTFAHAQGTELALALKKGKAYKQVSNSKVTIVQDLNGEKVNMKMTVKSSLSFLVKSTKKDAYEMEVVYESLGLEMKLPQVTMSFDSEKNDEQDVFSVILSEMRNKPFKVKMSRLGRIEGVEDMEDIFESAFERFPELPKAKVQQMRGQLVRAFGEESFVGNSQITTTIFPDKPVVEGETWAVTTNFRSGMASKISTKYTLEKIAGNQVSISGNSEIESTDKETYFELNGVFLKYDLTGSRVSDIRIDKSTGWVIEAKISQNITGDSYMQESQIMPDGMKIPMSIKNESVFTGN